VLGFDAPPGAPPALAELLPVTPTVRRAFRPSDAVTAFVRVYQNAAPFVPATVTARIVDQQGSVAHEHAETVRGITAEFGSAADFRLAVPVQQLSPGEYLLTVTIDGRGRGVQRTARFRLTGWPSR
jgi:hypothetical protein